MAGATNVGAIEGTLRLEAGEFHREIERAIAEVETLDGKKVDVKVKTNASSAEREIRSMSGGLDSAVAASRRMEDATSRVSVAELRLSELRDSGRAKASQIATAEGVLTKARRAEQDAIFATYAGNVALSKAQDEVTRGAKDAAKGVSGLTDSFGSLSLSNPAVLAGGIAAAVALIGPASGAATAGVAGLVGVAGTALLAYKGLQDEMQRGTALGTEVQSSFAGITSEIDALGSTAVHAMEGDLLSALGKVRSFLPTLNGDVQALAGHLGNAANITMGGVVAGFHTLMPLLDDGGHYAEILAQKFADFAASDQFRQFVDYARRELPNVGQALLSLALGAKDLAVALAPVGDDLIELIHVSGQAASSIAPVVSWLSKIAHGANAASNYTLAQSIALGKVSDAATTASGAIADHTSYLTTLTGVQSGLAASLGTTDQALNNTRDAQKQAADAAANATAQMYNQNDAAGLLKAALDKLNGKALNVAETQNTFDSALANSNKHVDAAGKTIDRATTSLKGNSAAAVANRGELIHQIKAAEDVAVAYRDNGKSQDETRAKMVLMRQQIINQAVAHGENRQQVTNFIDTLLKIPPKVPPTKLEVETAAAMAGIAAFQKAIDSLHGNTVTAKVRYAYTGTLPNGGHSTAGGSTFADGGILANAGGNLFEAHVAQIAPAGAMRLWAEPETGGEAYIPLAPSKRGRSQAILNEVNRMFGNNGQSVELGQSTIMAIAAAVSRVKVQSTVTAGQFDVAMGGLR